MSQHYRRVHPAPRFSATLRHCLHLRSRSAQCSASLAAFSTQSRMKVTQQPALLRQPHSNLVPTFAQRCGAHPVTQHRRQLALQQASLPQRVRGICQADVQQVESSRSDSHCGARIFKLN